jgi:hypothetical protein
VRAAAALATLAAVVAAWVWGRRQPALPARRQRLRLLDEYPSINVAYELTKMSYDLGARRLDAVENRGRAVLTFAGTLTFAMPVFAVSVLGQGARQFASPWFLGALVAFGGILICGGLLTAAIDYRLPSPKKIYEEHLDEQPDQFKANQIAYAAEDFIKNRDLINRLARTATIAMLLLLLEAAFFGAWILTG